MKCFLVFDSNYAVREYIGYCFAHCEDEVKQVVRQLLQEGACREADNPDEYIEEWIRIEDLQEQLRGYLEDLKNAPEEELRRVRELMENPTEEGITDFFCDGFNWLGDLRKALGR